MLNWDLNSNKKKSSKLNKYLSNANLYCRKNIQAIKTCILFRFYSYAVFMNDIYKCDFGTEICNKEISLSHITWQKKDWDKILVFFFGVFIWHFISFTIYFSYLCMQKILTEIKAVLGTMIVVFTVIHTYECRCFQLSPFPLFNCLSCLHAFR